ncbi:DNA cytosine methyltransferase [Lentisalinibacter salinarum]|uniref:DNA cytosine methyltransferase n=1 Tax=Lentisalinibacter salinarum TaxID=2992239 RepID=UPI00386A90BE
MLRQTGEAFIVIGGPPCQAYSLVGRARNQGVAGYRPEEDERHFLYREYLRVLDTVQPEIFVMENVKGILSSSVGGSRLFPRLCDDLRRPGSALGKRRGPKYEIHSLVCNSDPEGKPEISRSDYVIRSESYGIPQTRHRVILLGVRRDLRVEPGKLFPSSVVNAGDVLADLPRLRSGLSRQEDSFSEWRRTVESAGRLVSRELARFDFDIDAIRRVTDLDPMPKRRGARFVASRRKYRGPRALEWWYKDKELGGFANHETRGHVVGDLARYLFCSAFTCLNGGENLRSQGFPGSLKPNHRNWQSGKFADRFKVQARNKPSSTVTSHISKDGHYYIHYEPSQCRSLTVREAARLQTFPDNYFFEGNRTQQYVQVGNAVPPFLAYQIARIVHETLGCV